MSQYDNFTRFGASLALGQAPEIGCPDKKRGYEGEDLINIHATRYRHGSKRFFLAICEGESGCPDCLIRRAGGEGIKIEI